MYGSKIWVVVGSMMKVMDGFHHLIAHRIAGNMERRIGAEGW